MDRIYKLLVLLFFISVFFNISSFSREWNNINLEVCEIKYTNQDSGYINEYFEFIQKGIKSTESFFEEPFNQKFDIYIHPDRESLDKQWQTDWLMPEFKSECWMVASGVSTRMDILSPAIWDKQACEHSYGNKIKTQNLITHELVHVYHGQRNISPDFFETYGINWFIEGLATFVSGQCDSTRIADVKNAMNGGVVPKSLDDFWSGNLRYGLSGTMVMYIEHKYGKSKIIESLKYNRLEDILELLAVSETTLINGWKNYLSNYK